MQPKQEKLSVFDLFSKTGPPLKISPLFSFERVPASFFILFSNLIFLIFLVCLSVFPRESFHFYSLEIEKTYTKKCGERRQNQQILITRFALSALMSPIPNSRSKYLPFPQCLILLIVVQHLDWFLLSLRLAIAVSESLLTLFYSIGLSCVVLCFIPFSCVLILYQCFIFMLENFTIIKFYHVFDDETSKLSITCSYLRLLERPYDMFM